MDVLGAANLMSSSRKASLVIKDHQLQGVITFNHILQAVVAAGRDPTTTTVGDIIPPDNCPMLCGDKTILDALVVMQEKGVQEVAVAADNGSTTGGRGKVGGLVSVMDLVQSFSRLGGDDGGRCFWTSTMLHDDDSWETASDITASTTGGRGGSSLKKGVCGSGKTVASLRPAKAVVVSTNLTVLEVSDFQSKSSCGGKTTMDVENGQHYYSSGQDAYALYSLMLCPFSQQLLLLFLL